MVVEGSGEAHYRQVRPDGARHPQRTPARGVRGTTRDRRVRKDSRGRSRGSALLAARRDEVRVGAGERRSFEEVIRTPTELVLSGVEGG